MTSICIFEDAGWTALRPITDLRPVSTIQIGGASIVDRIRCAFPNATVQLNVRPELAEFAGELAPHCTINSATDTCPLVLFNGRALPIQPVLTQLQNALALSTNTLFTYQGTIVALILNTPLSPASLLLDPALDSRSILPQMNTLLPSVEMHHCDIISAPWDLGRLLPAAIVDTASQLKMGQIHGQPTPFTAIHNESDVYIGQSTVIEDFVVIDARSGPVIIGDHVLIESHSRITGPTTIGTHSQILGGKIRGSSIGPWCKISGEVSSCLFAGYTNKAHDGFWGNSYIGHWGNIGAGSITSNLKNTYGSVTLEYEGIRIDTGQQFLGAIVGDHVKLGIGTHLATGTIIGTASSIFGTVIHDKFIPNFSWGEPSGYKIAEIDRVLVTTQRVHARRGLTLSNAEALLLRSHHSDRSSRR